VIVVARSLAVLRQELKRNENFMTITRKTARIHVVRQKLFYTSMPSSAALRAVCDCSCKFTGGFAPTTEAKREFHDYNKK
jgi:hypothetical protein